MIHLFFLFTNTHMCAYMQTQAQAYVYIIFLLLHNCYLWIHHWFTESRQLINVTLGPRRASLGGSQGSGRWFTSCLYLQASLSIHGMCGGPMLGLFSLGLLFPFVNWKVRTLPSSRPSAQTGDLGISFSLSSLCGKLFARMSS